MDVNKSTCLISVIIPTYNRSNLLEYSLRSLVLQDIDKNDFEVVIGDDGSSDDTREVIRKYEDRVNIQYTYQEDKGYRPASARNNAIKIAKGEICLFVDSGIILGQDCLRIHIDFHRTKGSGNIAIGYVYGFEHVGERETRLKKMINFDDPGASIKEISKYEEYHDVRNRHYVFHNDRIHDLPAPWAFFWTGHVSVSRENLFKVGLFDQQFDGLWGIEDNDLGYRLHLAGIQMHLLRNATCIHYPHNTDKSGKELQGLQNCSYFNSKYLTLETSLFLKYYSDPEYVDINTVMLQMAGNMKHV